MKRSLVTTLIIGVAVAAIIGAAHATGFILRFELATTDLISDYARAARVVGDKWQYVFVLLAAFGVAWLTLTSVPRRVGLLILFFVVELLGASWICSLYRIFFQPIPSIFAAIVAFAAAEGWIVFLRRTRSHQATTFFAGRLSKKELRRVIEGAIPFDAQPKAHEVTVVVCDIANKHGLAEDSEPAAFAETTEKFLRRITERFQKAGAYIQAADGEGVAAIFGFPDSNVEHADKAVRAAFDLVQSFRDSRGQNTGEIFGNCDTHLGISTGTVIVAPVNDGEHPALLTSGEPVEFARRFCAANRFYGSHILIGLRTFDLASEVILARPIDFLSGVDSQERHEIYEPLWLVAEAKPEHIALRDSFWNGVVLYREKRWAEAYTEFQKARGSDEEEDAPLQFYLRRLEPLAFTLRETPSG